MFRCSWFYVINEMFTGESSLINPPFRLRMSPQQFKAIGGGDCMTPEMALAKQIERYRCMTGEERLYIALNLHAFACDIAREGIRRQFPNADEGEVDQRLRQRLEAAYHEN